MIDISSTLTWWKFFSIWVYEDLLHTEMLLQYAIIIVCWLSAYLIGLVIEKRLESKKNSEEKEKKHSIIIEIIIRIITRLSSSLIVLVLLGAVILLYNFLELPSGVISRFATLVIAWAVIRLGSAFIENPAISHAVTTIIWIIAALDILGYRLLAIEWLESFKISEEPEALSLYGIVSSALSVSLFMWLALVIAKILDKAFSNSPYLSLSAQALFSKISKFLLVAAAFLIGLNMVGINLTAFAVFGGAIAVGIGLGLQKVFSNLIAGIILLLDKSIKPGDTLYFSGHYGKVNKLSARYVSMMTRDGTEHLIPNDELINNQVENWSYSDTNVRLRIPIGVHYDSDVELAIKLAIESAQAVPRVLYHPAPACLIKGFGDNSVDLELRIWVRDPMAGCANVKSQSLLEVWKRFNAHNIVFPYPQRDVYLHTRPEDVASKEIITDMQSLKAQQH